ncbi:hypothetical protein ANCDUO_05299 [Ancylostoma duodenale]|uniref:Uncharacterized protein n=1 Tax=Ancylostoma duodenale TaxID=51022 RepID=A0A0C2H4V5_9BILA|nr:hypothetical protein ANCDUO_05299 [Ancylostoma duodenale]
MQIAAQQKTVEVQNKICNWPKGQATIERRDLSWVKHSWCRRHIKSLWGAKPNHSITATAIIITITATVTAVKGGGPGGFRGPGGYVGSGPYGPGELPYSGNFGSGGYRPGGYGGNFGRYPVSI